MRVAITGASGLIGWHLSCTLRALGHDAVGIRRDAFASVNALTGALSGIDAVVHAAGANRGPDEQVFDTNVCLARCVGEALGRIETAPVVVFTNSTHVERDTAYGRSKRKAAAILADAAPGRLVDLVLPGVFGEHGRPFHNSVVSTFAHELANGDELTVNDDASLELLHAQDAADAIADHIVEGKFGTFRVDGTRTTVHALAHRMTELSQRYDEGVVPALKDSFDRALFNTLRSYRFPHRYPISLTPRSDQRGSLVEVMKADTGGQVFLSWTEPGVTRGNHFHRRKVERFVVVEGTARISLRRLGCSEVQHVDVDGSRPVAIDVPTLHTHNITNTGHGPLTTVFWADEIFDEANPDTFAEVV